MWMHACYASPVVHSLSPACSCSQAFKNLDWSQFKLVFEALHERNVLLKNVPYLSNPLPIMTVGRWLFVSVKMVLRWAACVARTMRPACPAPAHLDGAFAFRTRGRWLGNWRTLQLLSTTWPACPQPASPAVARPARPPRRPCSPATRGGSTPSHRSRLSYSCAIPPSLPLPPSSPATSDESTPSQLVRPPQPFWLYPSLLPSPPFSQPCYKWWEPPYFWAGLRMYDLIAGKEGLEWCRYLTPSQVRHWFP